MWGDHVFVEERTVDVHIRRLRQVLEPTGHDVLLETVRTVGYRFRVELPAEVVFSADPAGKNGASAPQFPIAATH